jgi:hypothetical protein
MLRIAGFVDFVHSSEFQILENTTFRKLDLFPSSGKGREAPGPVVGVSLLHMKWKRLVLSKGPNRVGVSLS